MTFTAEQLLLRLDELQDGLPARRYLVAFSGGLDSTVLLHALAAARTRHDVPVVAVHINHGLQSDADQWEAHCRSFAAGLDVPFVARRIAVAKATGRGTEAAAREARYAALSALTQSGDVVLSAHHQDDQAETLLLNLVRGSGPGGIAGIGALQALGAGRLARPLLDTARKDLLEYAERAGVDWLDDPSNSDLAFDRNFLRREVLPRLARRWPAAAAGLQRSARLASESQALQTELADHDLAALGWPAGDPRTIDIAALRGLSSVRQRNLLRRVIQLRGLPPPPNRRLFEAVETLIPAAPDARPLVRWPGAELRRYRERLFILPATSFASPQLPLRLAADGTDLDLGPGLGSLQLSQGVAGGIGREHVGDGLEVRFRSGGERFRPHGRRETQRLKKLLQAAGVVPWMRGWIPLLYANGSLLAVADLWVAESAWSAQGLSVHWRDRPSFT